jgi:hypothetical protein
MRRIALDLHGFALVDGNQDSASVGAIMRAGSMDHFFHDA